MIKRIRTFLSTRMLCMSCTGFLGCLGVMAIAFMGGGIFQPITVQAEGTTGTLLIVDEADLLTDVEEARLINDYSVITEYMGF